MDNSRRVSWGKQRKVWCHLTAGICGTRGNTNLPSLLVMRHGSERSVASFPSCVRWKHAHDLMQKTMHKPMQTTNASNFTNANVNGNVGDLHQLPLKIHNICSSNHCLLQWTARGRHSRGHATGNHLVQVLRGCALAFTRIFELQDCEADHLLES